MTRFDLFIGGQWVEGTTYRPNVNPSDLSDDLGEYAQADREQTEEAIRAARTAAPAWANSNVQARADALDRIGHEILERKEELGRLLAREEGKTLKEGIGEVGRAGNIFKFFAGEALRNHGELHQSVRPGVRVEVTREPLGVVGVITPWNFPSAIPAWKIAPALAFGNAVVAKPAELAPGSAWALAEIISRAGLPPGVFNLVLGEGQSAGRTIVDSPDVDGVTFTGSVAVGHEILTRAAARHAKVQLEMGGKNPFVVLDDAELGVAVECAVQGAYYSTGQRCTASSRLIVTEKIHDRFVEALTARMKTIRVGDALEPETDIGPVVDESQLRQDLEYLDIGRREGARVACGGERLPLAKQGYYLGPALFVDTDNRMRINREEIFGPIASVIRVKDFEEAVAVANDTDFGLSAGVATTSLENAERFKLACRAGMVMVNLPTAGVDYHVPFGGRKASSYGPREQGVYAKEFYTTVKTAYVSA
ncbi:MAG TPA: aldehyde dehydrogenase family protein [Vicinamibacteria bacterium]|nr:aldehyde dehydrogenase family protein [Vicinamibacteria bacterium]